MPSRLHATVTAISVVSLVTMLFASSAMATSGVLRDVNTGMELESETVLQFTGHAYFISTQWGSVRCQVTSQATMTDASTGEVTDFSVTTESFPEPFPDRFVCEGSGNLSSCEVTEATDVNPPYGLAVMTDGFDVTGLAVDLTFAPAAFCPFENVSMTTETIDFSPLEEGDRVVWGTEGNLGDATEPGDPIAGFSLSGTADLGFGTYPFTGELELKEPNRSAWEISEF